MSSKLRDAAEGQCCVRCGVSNGTVVLALEKLRQLLSYNPDSGDFFWRVDHSRHGKAGARAGIVGALGYVMITAWGKQYYAHRLAWLFVYESVPKLIDHIDRDQLNNRIGNLREATKSLNGINRGPQRNNTSGFKGVVKHHRKWVAQVNRSGKAIYLGLFPSKETAAAAVKAYEQA